MTRRGMQYNNSHQRRAKRLIGQSAGVPHRSLTTLRVIRCRVAVTFARRRGAASYAHHQFRSITTRRVCRARYIGGATPFPIHPADVPKPQQTGPSRDLLSAAPEHKPRLRRVRDQNLPHCPTCWCVWVDSKQEPGSTAVS